VQVDWYLIVIALLLIATLVGFLTGIFPYPFGSLLLLALFGIRLMKRRNRRQDKEQVTGWK
jgi:hypothetical protein